ncbi:lipoprotein intramolecular transacylase Lit [Raoultibacter phocaeensis]|uniref:lipoprotein intramolecular transacylase Lit n=1 Tax=Raoultibacter phocaeensis TaxID=2479841 RepID=UPI00111A614F|nr:DUF1461 domain-containing protein [Raoultibacter phocaeensis]
MPKTESTHRGGPLASVLTAIAAVTLAVTLVAAGLAACCARPATAMLSQATSAADLSPYSRGTLIDLAVATRDYTVDGIPREDVLEAIAAAARAEAPEVLADSDDPAIALADAPERYTLTEDALSHLDDVYAVISTAVPVLIGCAIVALASLIALGFLAGRRRVGNTLIAAPIIVIAAFAALAAWVIVDFNGFFAAFHSLFFANGTWTFSADSLLICMYPPDFWIGMGAIWLATTLAASIVAILVGIAVKGRATRA